MAFASKSLTVTEMRYTNSERELFTMVFTYEHFYNYIYGPDFLSRVSMNCSK